MFRKMIKLTGPESLAVIQMFLLTLFFIGITASLVYADIENEMDGVASTFLGILTGPVSMVIGGALVIVAVIQLIQKNWSAGMSLLLAAILLIKLKDLMNMFGG